MHPQSTRATLIAGFALVLTLSLLHGASFVSADSTGCEANNLLANCSFETATGTTTPDSWTPGGYGTNAATFLYPVSGISSSSKAVKIEISSYTDGDAKWLFTPVTVSGSHTYTYSDSYQANVVTMLVIEINSGTSTSYAGFLDVPASASWVSSSITFSVPSTATSVRVYHTISNIGTLLLDDASLKDQSSIPSSITISPTSLPSAVVGNVYAQTLTASTSAAGPFVWSVSAGSLPAGLTLSTSTELTSTISGTPTATTTSNFTIQMTNGVSAVSKPYTIAVLGTTAVVKTVVYVTNDNGGTNESSDFNVSVTGASAAPSLFPGSSSGTSVTVSPLTPYAISTNPGLFYTVTYSPDCNSSVSSPDSVTCTIMLNDIAALTAGQSSNLVKNPSMESPDLATGSTTPQFWTAGGYGTNNRVFSYPIMGVAAGEGGENGVAAKIDITSYADGDAKWVFSDVPVIAGHSYVYTDNYISTVPTTLVVGFTVNNTLTFTNFVSVPASASATTWKTATTQFNAPAGATAVTVYHALSSVGSLSLDNVSITEVAQPISFDQGFVSLTFDDSLQNQYTLGIPALDSKNLKGSFYVISHLVEGLSLQNGTLDTPSVGSSTIPLGWNTTGSNNATFAYPVAGKSGNGARVSATTASSNAGWYFTPVTVLPDGIYTFSDDYMSTAASSVIIRVTTASTTKNAEFTDINGNDLNKSTLALPSTGGAWVNTRQYFYIPADAVSVTVLHRLTGSGALTIDNMRFGQVGYMTAEELLAMQADGQEIGGHTQTHAALASLTTDRATQEIAGNRQELLGGGSAPVLTMVYPYGSYNSSVEQITENAGYIGARSVVPGFNGRNSDKYALLSQSVDADTPISQIQSWIDLAKANKQWLILTFHGIENDTTGDPYSATPATLQQIVNYLVASDVPVLTMKQGIDRMGAPKINVSFSVTNSHNGTSTPANFTALVTGANASPSTFAGSASSTPVSIDANTSYSVTLQNIPSNYTYATSTGCAGQLAIGAQASCSISIQDIATIPATTTATSTATTTPPTPSTLNNLILNASFEAADPANANAPQYWGQGAWGTNTRTYSYPAPGKTGNGAKVSVSAYTSGDVKWVFNYVSVVPGHTYTYTDSYLSGIASKLEIEYMASNGTLTYANATPIPASGVWGSAALTFTVPVGVTSLRVFHYIAGVGDLTLDDVSLVDTNSISTPPTPPTPPTGTTTPSTTNLLPNPSLATPQSSDSSQPQSWSKDFWGTNTNVFTYPVTGKTDATAVKVQITSYSSGDAKWAPDFIFVTAGHTYTFSDSYQSNINSKLGVEYKSSNGGLSYNNFTSFSPSAVWGSATINFTVPQGVVSVRIFHIIENVGTLTLDDASLVDTNAPAPVQTNIVANPSFKTANSTQSLPQNWTTDSWGSNTASFTYPVSGQTDAAAAKVQITSYSSGDAKWIMDPISVHSGESYTYTDSYMSDAATQVGVEYISSNNSYSYANFSAVPTSNMWGSSQLIFTVPTNAVSMRVFHILGSVGALTIDDVSVVKN